MQTVINNILKFQLSAEELSKKSHIPIHRIHEILQKANEPLISEVRAIAKALKVQPDFLLSDSNSYRSINAIFRKNVNEKGEIIADRISYILSNALFLLGSYRPNIEIMDKFPKVENTYKGVLELASLFRQQFFRSDFVSPLLNLPEIIVEQLDCILLSVELGTSVDGASAIINGVPFILISPRFKPRMLFTLAHELGHIIAHHRDSENFASIDTNTFRLNKKSRENEMFAYAFAAEILMPQEGVAKTLQFLRTKFSFNPNFIGEIELLYLSRIYGVSFEVAALRCENLGILPEGAAVSLYDSLKKEFGGPEKRAEQLDLPARPGLNFPKISPNLMEAAIGKINNEEISLGRAAELLSISITDLIHYNAFKEWI